MILAPLLVLAVLEGVCRLVEPRDDLVAVGKDPEWRVPRWVAQDPSISGQFAQLDAISPDLDKAAIFRFWTFYRRDPDLHYRLRPNLAAGTVNTFVPKRWADRMRWEITSNADGFRGPVLPAVPLPAGEKLVVCLGDSSTYGWGVAEPEAFPVRLERHLNATGTGRYQVVSLGHPGYTSWQGRILAERLASLRPTVVTIAYGPNDSSAAGMTDRELWERDQSLPARAAAVAEHLALYRTMRRAILAVWNPAERAATGKAELRSRVPLREYDANLRTIVRTVRAAGATPILIGIGLQGPYLALMVRVATETQTPFRDAEQLYTAALPAVKEGTAYAAEVEKIRGSLREILDQQELFYLKVDPTHPNPIGHDLIARTLTGLILGTAPPPEAGLE